MMTSKKDSKPAIAAWEAAEIERSAYEASSVDIASMWIGDKDRYLNPPKDTAFPLEYCYYLLGDIQDKVVFDLGCGSGENTLLLAMRGVKIYALDISPELIELGLKRFEVNHVSAEKVEFMVGSAYEIALPDESVDIVFGIGILHHLDLQLVQKEVYRILRNGGFAIFQEPVRDSKLIRFLRGLIPYKSPEVSPFERPLTSQEINSFASPFRIVEQRSFWLPLVSIVSLILPRYIMAACRWDGKILAALPFLNKYAGIRVLKLSKSNQIED